MTKKQAQAIREQIARAHPFVSCGSCNENGLIWQGPSAAHALVARCRCWFAHQAKVEHLIAARAAEQGRVNG